MLLLQLMGVVLLGMAVTTGGLVILYNIYKGARRWGRQTRPGRQR